MNPSSQDIKDILEAESSLSLTFATNLFVGKELAEPDNCVTIFDTPGRAPQLTMGAKSDSGYFYPSIQIRVRNNSYSDGWELINDIKTLLHGITGETWNSMIYDLIQCTGEPFLLDWDENDRARFVCTFNIQRKEV